MTSYGGRGHLPGVAHRLGVIAEGAEGSQIGHGFLWTVTDRGRATHGATPTGSGADCIVR